MKLTLTATRRLRRRSSLLGLLTLAICASPAHATTTQWGTNGDIPVAADFTGDGVADVAIYRPAVGAWCFQFSNSCTTWGTAGDIPVPADYTGDHIADGAVFRPSTGDWWVYGQNAVHWGQNGDIPVPGDYNGDGTADMAIFRPSAGAWCFRVYNSCTTWGTAGDKPVPGDYNGDGKTDGAVFRPSTGDWWIYGQNAVHWGQNGDIPVPADYDGNGTTDLAIFRPSTGDWCFKNTNSCTHWGQVNDVPAPGDYTGDHIADGMVFRPSTGTWWQYESGAGGGVRTFLPDGAHCAAATPWTSGSVLGMSLGRSPSRIATPSTPQDNLERQAFLGAAQCFREVAGGRTPAVRMQLSIDALRPHGGGDNEPNGTTEIAAFANLLQAVGGNGPGIISIAPHNLGCASASEVSEAQVPDSASLGPCHFPTVALYRKMFAEINSAVTAATHRSDIIFTAWNEPENGSFTLQPALGTTGAITRAGQYFGQAVAVVGNARVLAGEFNGTGTNYQTTFSNAAGLTPAAWALHPYSDMTQNYSAGFPALSEFQSRPGISGRPVWMTEVGPLLANGSTRYSMDNAPLNQLSSGYGLRVRFTQQSTQALLYNMSSSSDGNWDSALSDGSGVARPVICGIGGIPLNQCQGSPVAYH